MNRIAISADHQQVIQALLVKVLGAVVAGVFTVSFVPYIEISLLLLAFVVFMFGRMIWRSVNQLQNNEIIVLDDQGITDRSWGLGFVPWTNIKDVTLREVDSLLGPSTMVELELNNPEAYFAASSSLDRWFIKKGLERNPDHQYAGFLLNADLTDHSAKELRRLIREYVNEFSSPDAV